MKAKHVITTFVFATAMVFGAATTIAANHNVRMASAEADLTVYLELSDQWAGKLEWGSPHVYYWGGANATDWPGTEMTLVSGKIYTANIEADSAGLIFNMNDSKGSWNGDTQTEDLALEEGKDLFTVTSSNDDSKQTGVWSKYVAPVPDVPDEDGYYLVGTKTNWKFEGAPKLGAGDEGNNAILLGYAVEENEEFKVRGYFEEVDTWYGTSPDGQNYVADEDKTVDVYLSKDGHIYVSDHVEPTPDPEYYLAGSMNDWTKGEGYILNKTEETPEGFVAQYALEDFDLTADDEFKITDGTAYFGFDRLEANVLFEGADDGLGGENIKALLTAQYDIFLKVAADPANTKIYIGVDKVDPDKVNKNTFYVYDMGGVLGDDIAKLNIYGFGQAANINAMEYPGVHDGDYVVIEEHEVAGIEHLYKVQLSVSFTKFIVNNGNGDGDRQTTNIEEIKAGQVYYIDTDADLEGKYPGAWYSLDDLGVENGTYIRGDWGDGWAVKGQKTMHTNPGEGKEHEQMIEGLLLSAGSKLKVVCYTDHIPAWHGATEVYLGEDQLVDAIDEDGNAIVPNNGSYNLYVDTNTWIYYFTISENEALAKALEYVDLFHSTLRAEGVCDVEHGKTTNVEALATAWATLKTEYGKITLEGAKELLVAGTANAELVAFAKLYDMIIAKYSAHLGVDANFLNRSSSSAADVVAVNTTVDNTAMLIALVATISSIALVASVLAIKKRKASK